MLRIMAEYQEAEKRLRDSGIEDTIVFFGSARTLSRDDAQEQLTQLQKDKKTPAEDIARATRDVEMSSYYEAARELAGRLTKWAKDLALEQHDPLQRFSVVTGGGPGIMEAANRGAEEAGGSTIGMNISLPFEQYPNEYISDGLAFEFHYFFIRKFWLVYLAKAAIIMPGGYGTLDEFMEILTLIQTEKIGRKFPIVLFGSKYWEKVIDFSHMAEFGTINPVDLDLFHVTDSVDDAFDWLTAELAAWAVDNPGGGFTTEAEKIGPRET